MDVGDDNNETKEKQPNNSQEKKDQPAQTSLRENMKNYIQGLKSKGVNENLVKEYEKKLNSLSDEQLVQNAEKFKFSDKNQRNNMTNVDDQSLGYRTGDVMCFPTSVAIALSNLGVENPVAPLGIQYEDFLDDVIRNDSEISSSAKGVRPRVAISAEEKMINKYFGDKVTVTRRENPWEDKSYSGMLNTFKEINQQYLNQGAQVIIGTGLTHGGHVVVLTGISEGGVSITDPYGRPRPGIETRTKTIRLSSYYQITHTWSEYVCNYDRNDYEMNSTKGENIFLSWDYAWGLGVGKRWYMVIERKKAD